MNARGEPAAKISPDECERIGGHCFVGDGYVLASNPPQHPETCKHCGKRRIGTPREPMEWRDA